MTEQYSLDLDEAQFAKMLFDHVREMSKDVAGVTRQGYGPLETQVLEYLKGIGGKLDLDIQTDLAGNVWMTLPGTDRTLPAFVSGSHADSVPQGGNYDGLAGIVAALCAAHWMRRHHSRLHRPDDEVRRELFLRQSLRRFAWHDGKTHRRRSCT